VILLDANVVSEPFKAIPNASVLAWLDAQAPETLFLSAISLAELRSGVALLPTGKRRSALDEALKVLVSTLLPNRVLAFDATAADAFAAANAGARRAGNIISFPDCAIAATAAAHHLSIASRNGDDFRGTGIAVIDPWAWRG
jgi:toxin FitB